MFKTIDGEVSAEITEKKSKFIANVFYIETLKEAEDKIKKIRKKYYDARHNCFAFSIMTESGKIERFSDDGEPSGTAGSPMLNIINGNGLSNILVIVTRYFGGILLGTGGLVRAYSEALQKALESVNIINKEVGIIAKFTVKYQDMDSLKYYFKKENIKIIRNEFDENANFFVEITRDKYNFILEKKSGNLLPILVSSIEREAVMIDTSVE